MTLICYARHRFSPAVSQHTVWLYLRFSLSYRDIEDLLAEGELDISYEATSLDHQVRAPSDGSLALTSAENL